jgi:hypothetical protein
MTSQATYTAISDLPVRLASRISINSKSGCWEWTGSKFRNGYGQVGHCGRNWLVHRLIYTLLVGPIPEGLTLDHVKARGCIYRHCCNPAHLEPVTNRENLMRGNGVSARAARKTHCDHGHEFTPGNTRITKRGFRQCIACARRTEGARWKSARPRLREPRTHCIRGHLWIPENLYVRPSGRKECGICKHIARVGEVAA